MRSNHIVAALAVVACLSLASLAVAGPPQHGATEISTVAGPAVTGACVFYPGDSCQIVAGGAGACTIYDAAYLGDGSTCCDFSSGVTGACCCSALALGACTLVSDAIESPAARCDTYCLASFTYQGDGTSCIAAATNDCSSVDNCSPPVPAVSQWGIASLGLLLLTGATIRLRAFRKAA